MLFARLQREHIRARAIRIHGLARNAAGQVAHKLLRCSHKANIRPAKGERKAQRLSVADGHIRAVIARALQEAQGKRVHISSKQAARRMGCPCKRLHILQAAQEVRLRGKEARAACKRRRKRGLIRSAIRPEGHFHKLDLGEARIGFHRSDHIRVQPGGIRYLALALGIGKHVHSLCRCGCAIVYGRIRHIHAGQGADERLPFKDRLQHALAHLRLVRRISGIEFAAGCKLRHGCGDVMVVCARAAEDGKRRVILLHERRKEPAHAHLAHAVRQL